MGTDIHELRSWQLVDGETPLGVPVLIWGPPDNMACATRVQTERGEMLWAIGENQNGPIVLGPQAEPTHWRPRPTPPNTN